MNMEKLIRMDEYCSSVRDGTHDTPKPTESGYYLVTSKAINNNTIDFKECYYISEDDYIKINKRSQVDKWDVIMTMIGTVGRLHLVKDVPQYAIKNIALFKLGDEHRAKWLYYYLSTSTVQSYFDLVASGTSQHFIGLGNLRKFKVEEYRDNSKRITDILSTYDSLIELNTKRIKTLEQMAENLYKEWFVRFRFPGHEKAEFENGIPKGWEYKKLNELIDVRYGKDHKSIEDGDIPVFGSGGIMRYGDKQLYSGETVLIPRKGTLNNIMYFNGPLWTVDTMFYSVPLIENFAKYAYYTLSKFDMESFNSGAALPSMTTNILYHFKMLVPDADLLKKFDTFVSTLFLQKEALQKENDNLIKQRDLLLPRLMSGKLEV